MKSGNLFDVSKIRKYGWSQGSLLKLEKPTIPVNGKNCIDPGLYMLISHPCLIANQSLDLEPYVEVLYCNPIDKPDGSFVYGKSPRKIHIEFHKGNKPVFFECMAINLYVLPRTTLINIKLCDEYSISKGVITCIRGWRTKRYDRDAFPDQFNKRLDRKGLKKIINNDHKDISAICVRLNTDKELPEDQYYEIELVVLLVNESNNVPPEMQKKWDVTLERLVETIEKNNIKVLSNYSTKSPDQITLHELNNLREIDFDYLSY